MKIGTTNNPTPTTPTAGSPTAVRTLRPDDLVLANNGSIPAGTWALELTSPVIVVDDSTGRQVAPRSTTGKLTFNAIAGKLYRIAWNFGKSYVKVTAASVSAPPAKPTSIEIANVRCFESSNEGVTDRQIALARQAADGAPFALRVWWELNGSFLGFQNPAGLAGAAKIADAGGLLLATIAAQHPRDGTFRIPATLDAARNAGQRVSTAMMNAKVPTRTTLLQIFNEVDNGWDKGGFWPGGNWKQAMGIAAAFAEPLRAAGYVCGSPSFAIHDEFRMREFTEHLASSGLDKAFDAICCNYYAKNANAIQPTIEKSMDLLIAFARPRGLQVWVPELGPQLPSVDKTNPTRQIVPAMTTRIAQLAHLVAQVSRADVYSLYRMADHAAWGGMFTLFGFDGKPNAAFAPWCDANRPTAAELVVMGVVNAERAKVGLRALRYHGACADAARRTAAAVAPAMRGVTLTHDAMVVASRSAAKPGDAKSIGGVSAGSGQDLVQLAADAAAWATSPDHRPLLLDPNATMFGAGVVRGTTPSQMGVVPADFFWCAIDGRRVG